MKLYFSTFLLSVLLFLFFGCSTDNNDNDSDKKPDVEAPTLDQVIKDAEITNSMVTKADEFKKAITDNSTKPASVYIYRHTTDSYSTLAGAKKLAARLVVLGYTDVLIAIHPESGDLNSEIQNKDWFKVFNSYLNENKVKSHALMFSEASQYNLAKNIEIEIHASVIQNFNKTVEAKEQFAGAAADWEPHSLTASNSEAGEDGANLHMKERWADDRYYKNGPNDMLLARTADMLEYAKSSLDKLSRSNNTPLLPLNEAINYHVQEQYDMGNLNNGNVTNYLSDSKCQSVNVMAYNNKKEEVWRRAKVILDAADKSTISKSIFICIKTQLGDDEGPTTSLQPQGWDYLITTINYLHEQAKSYQSMCGISIYEYSGTESMWIQ